MPRLKKSPGRAEFKTVFPDEFQRYLMYELENSKQWNPELITRHLGVNSWEYATGWWTIRWTGRAIVVISDHPKIEIRKGLTIYMGSQRFEIQGNTP